MKVGKFTSPHLVRFNERITVNGRMISDEDVVRLGEMLLAEDFHTELTMFDYCLVMALLYFSEQNCDLVILEVGLGGRLDSTSALIQKPLVSVITRIGFDHMAILGNTLAEIASEKAGILRTGVPTVCAPQEAEALRTIAERSVELNGDDSLLIKVTSSELEGLRNLPLKMVGEYQLENAATALAAFRQVKMLSEEAEQEALCSATWSGRMEILSQEPFLMVDGAHNAHGVRALAKSLAVLYPDEKFHFIMGVMADKDYPDMIEVMLPLAYDFCTVTPDSSRALQGEQLAQMIRDRGIPASYEKDWRQLPIIQSIIEKTTYSDSHKWVCFGSLYFIGDVIQAIIY